MSSPAPFMPEQGRAHPLGSHVRDGGVNFAVFAQHAQAVEVCLYDPSGRHEQGRWRLHGPHDGVFHGFLPGRQTGQVYGLRAYGPYAPEQGHRYNPHKLLLDPCARDIVGRFEWRDIHLGYVAGHPDGTRSFDVRDNGELALKARVAPPPSAALRETLSASRPRHALTDVVLYEVHVKGCTQTLPGVPEALRGTYAGLAHPAAVAHFKRLGITTLSLLPVQYAVSEQHLARQGKTNYWGYNTLGFFCPDPRWSTTPDDTRAAADEFRTMVRELHAAGLEVVMDVVYNHTAEAAEDGPTLSFRGLDHVSWYRLVPDDLSRCENLTGCGNTVAVWHPRVTQFVLDSLRYWVQDMGVDGFRFDLAAVLGRTRGQYFHPDASFFTAIRQDPVLADVHLISEPWDSGPSGYQVGRFPGAFLDWNDQFRDAVRGYWLHGEPGLNHRAGSRPIGRGEMARRFAASSDLFHHSQRQPTASVNFITAHDGYTLRDVVSYHRKHNLGNGEDNRDGRDSELSANFGVEGPTDDAAVNAQRRRAQRAMMAMLLLAQGTPMLCAGDEIGKTQRGNNNAYCQDGPISWLDWAQADESMLALCAQLTALRRAHPALRHGQWFGGHGEGSEQPTLHWLGVSGRELEPHEWHDDADRRFACVFRHPGHPAVAVAFNPSHSVWEWPVGADRWRVALDTAEESAVDAPVDGASGATARVPARAVVVLVQEFS